MSHLRVNGSQMASGYDTNLDELENLLRDLDGRPTSVLPPSRKAKGSSSMDFGALDDIINVLGDNSRSAPQQRQPQSQSFVQQSHQPQQHHYQEPHQPQQHHHQSGYDSNRNTMDNIDDLLKGLESNRSSMRASVAPQPVRQAPPQQYQQAPAQSYNAQPRLNTASVYNAQPVNKRLTQAQAPNQKVFVAKPPSVRPVAGDDLNSLLDNLTKDTPLTGAPVPKGACSACGKHIVGESISALGNLYHPAHFNCGNCRQPIGTGSFFEQDGMPHCEKCYQELLCSRCAHCDEPILDKCVTAMGKKWHMNHFICTQCLSPFGSGRYFEKDGRPFCESCFGGNFAPRCGGCNQPIHGECTNALGQAWHPEHFVCQYCQKAFTGSFYEFAGKPYCDVHYHQQTGSLCAGCSKAITGKCVNALNKKWHPEHFICAFCMNPLVGGNFTENQNKAYCKDCHGKLFG